MPSVNLEPFDPGRESGGGQLSFDREKFLGGLALELHEILECNSGDRWSKLEKFTGDLEALRRNDRVSWDELVAILASRRGDEAPSVMHHLVLGEAPLQLLGRIAALGAPLDDLARIQLSPTAEILAAPLHCCARTNDANRFTELLRNGANLELRDSSRYAAPDIAAALLHRDVLEAAAVQGKWLAAPVHGRVAAYGKALNYSCDCFVRGKVWDYMPTFFAQIDRILAAASPDAREMLNFEYRSITGEIVPPVLHQLIAGEAPCEVIEAWLTRKPDIAKIAIVTGNKKITHVRLAPLDLAMRLQRMDIGDLLIAAGASILDRTADGRIRGVLPQVLEHGTVEMHRAAADQLMAAGEFAIVLRDLLPKVLTAQRWEEAINLVERGVPPPQHLHPPLRSALLSHVKDTMRDSFIREDWAAAGKILDRLPTIEKLCGSAVGHSLVWEKESRIAPARFEERFPSLAHEMIVHKAPEELVRRLIVLGGPFPENANGNVYDEEHPLCVCIRHDDAARFALLAAISADPTFLAHWNSPSNRVAVAVSSPQAAEKFLEPVLELVKNRANARPKEAALTLLNGLAFALKADQQEKILETMRTVRASFRPVVAETGLLEIRPEHAGLSGAEVHRLLFNPNLQTEPHMKQEQNLQLTERNSLSDAIAYAQAFDDIRKPVRTAPGVAGPFLRLLPAIHDRPERFESLMMQAGLSRKREVELFALLSSPKVDTRRHPERRTQAEKTVYAAIGASIGTENKDAPSATVLRHIGTLAFTFQRWNFDSKSIRDRDDALVSPSLLEQYGLRRLDSSFQYAALGQAFELPDDLKKFESWVDVDAGHRTNHQFDRKCHIILRRAYLSVSHPIYGRLIVPNPVLPGAREIFPHAAYWSTIHSMQDLGPQDFFTKGEKIEISSRRFSPVTFKGAEVRGRPEFDEMYGLNSPLDSETYAVAALVYMLRAWSEEYQGWKFDARFETSWDRQKQLIGGPRSRGYQAFVNQLEFALSAVEAKLLPFSHVQLYISPPDKPPYLAVPFPGLDGKQQYTLPVTRDVVAAMRRRTMEEMEMEGVYALFNTALGNCADLGISLTR